LKTRLTFLPKIAVSGDSSKFYLDFLIPVSTFLNFAKIGV